jgi:predicted MPP superfamily phosphohydrolase
MNDEPPVERRDRIHHLLVGLHALTRVPSALLAAMVLLLAALVGGAWYAVTGSPACALAAGGVTLAAVTADWAWLAALPRWGLSFGPVAPPLVGLMGIRLVLGVFPLAACAAGLEPRICLLAGAVLQALVWGLVAYTTAIEPFRLGVTHLELRTGKLPPGARVRLVQVSDLHVERLTRRERALIERVNALDADYVLLTGDYLNFSYIGEGRAIHDARQVLSSLRARHGTYAVRGTHQVDPNWLMPVLLEGLPIRWLRNEHLTHHRDDLAITFAGASCTRRSEIDVPAVEQALAGIPHDAFTVLLFHTPERVAQAQSAGVDLYLSGHTHGGQIRLPLYGALVTATETGKRYEMGRYEAGDMTLYVSRGLGMEGMAAPRARFLCPPEITCIDVRGP